MNKLRFGLIGCGVIHEWHTQVLANLSDDTEIVAVCDVDPARAKASADKLGVPFYTDYRELLARDDIDAVTIATPSGLHAEQATAALNAGKHVVCEKPMDISVHKARALVELASKSGLVLTPISQNRYGGGILQLHQWLDEGKLGKLVYGESRIIWYRSQGYYDSGDWRGTWELDGGGSLMNQGVHYADQLRWAMGPVKSLTAKAATLGHERIDVEDIVTASIAFQSGAVGTLTATTCAYPGWETSLQIYGTLGTVRIQDNELVHAKFTDGTEVLPEKKTDSVGGADPTAIGYYLHTQQFKDFVGAVREKRAPWITPEMGLQAVELVVGVYQSARNGSKVVTFPLPADTGRGDQ